MQIRLTILGQAFLFVEFSNRRPGCRLSLSVHVPDKRQPWFQRREHAMRCTFWRFAPRSRASRNTLKQHFRNLNEHNYLEQHGKGRGVWYGLK